jgi:hypothetical protein
VSRGNGTASAISEAASSPGAGFYLFLPKKGAQERSREFNPCRPPARRRNLHFSILLSVAQRNEIRRYRITGVSGAATECDSSCSSEGGEFIKTFFPETSKTGNGLKERDCIRLLAKLFLIFSSCLVYYATR